MLLTKWLRPILAQLTSGEDSSDHLHPLAGHFIPELLCAKIITNCKAEPELESLDASDAFTGEEQ